MKQDVYPEINLSQRIIYALNETYQQGEKVYYDNGSISGFGTVCGQSSNPVIFVGATYIIRPDVPFDPAVYNFTHFAIQQLYMKKL